MFIILFLFSLSASAQTQDTLYVCQFDHDPKLESYYLQTRIELKHEMVLRPFLNQELKSLGCTLVTSIAPNVTIEPKYVLEAKASSVRINSYVIQRSFEVSAKEEGELFKYYKSEYSFTYSKNLNTDNSECKILKRKLKKVIHDIYFAHFPVQIF